MTLLRNGFEARVVKKGLGSDSPYCLIRAESVTKPSPKLMPANVHHLVHIWCDKNTEQLERCKQTSNLLVLDMPTVVQQHYKTEIWTCLITVSRSSSCRGLQQQACTGLAGVACCCAEMNDLHGVKACFECKVLVPGRPSWPAPSIRKRVFGLT